MNKSLVLMWCWIIVTLVAWCAVNEDKNAESDLVKIWIVAPLSWPAASYGEDVVRVYKDAVNDYNTLTTWAKVELIMEDWKCNWQDSVSAVQKLINVDRVALILWWVCSAETVASWKIANANRVLMLSPFSSAPEISNLWDYIFRYWNDEDTSIILAQYATQNFKNIALVYENTDYAYALEKKFESLYTWNIGIKEAYESAEKDYLTMASKIESNPEIDGIVFIPQTEATAGLFVKALEQKNLLEKYRWKILSVYIFGSQAFLDQVWSLAEWLIQVNADNSTYWDLWNDYIKEYSSKYKINSLDIFIVLAKEWIESSLNAIAQWKKTSDEFKEFFNAISSSNQRKWYFGDYYFDAEWDAVWLNMRLEKVKDGKIVPYAE